MVKTYRINFMPAVQIKQKITLHNFKPYSFHTGMSGEPEKKFQFWEFKPLTLKIMANFKIYEIPSLISIVVNAYISGSLAFIYSK